MASRYTATTLSTMRSTTARTMPNMIARPRSAGGRPAAASAISTALSPDRIRLTPKILRRVSQLQLAQRASRSIAAASPGGWLAPPATAGPCGPADPSGAAAGRKACPTRPVSGLARRAAAARDGAHGTPLHPPGDGGDLVAGRALPDLVRD